MSGMGLWVKERRDKKERKEQKTIRKNIRKEMGVVQDKDIWHGKVIAGANKCWVCIMITPV